MVSVIYHMKEKFLLYKKYGKLLNLRVTEHIH